MGADRDSALILTLGTVTYFDFEMKNTGECECQALVVDVGASLCCRF